MQNHNHRKRAIPIGHFGKINTNYDVDEPLPKPKPTWRDRANCGHLKDQPELAMRIFFPSASSISISNEWPKERLEREYAEARKFCKPCPVKQECLDEAIEDDRDLAVGYRGDMDHVARKHLFYERKKQGLVREKKQNQLFTKRSDEGVIDDE